VHVSSPSTLNPICVNLFQDEIYGRAYGRTDGRREERKQGKQRAPFAYDFLSTCTTTEEHRKCNPNEMIEGTFYVQKIHSVWSWISTESAILWNVQP